MSTEDKDDRIKNARDADATREGHDIPANAAKPVEDDTAASSGGVSMSDLSKRCVHCGKRSKMRVVKDADSVESFPWAVRMLLKIFSPGGIELNKRYQCPRCGRNFNDMSVWEALIAPIMLVAFMTALLLGFFWFVFVIVPAR